MSEPLTCPNCGAVALEVTAMGDNERRYTCSDGCGAEWGVPFGEPDEQPGENV